MQIKYHQHITRLKQLYSQILEQTDHQAIAIFSGALKYQFRDDLTYPFKPNPNFLHWLPLTHHPECWLTFTPGQRPRLYYYQPVDYWHLPPEDPQGFWIDEFDIVVMREPRDIKKHLGEVVSMVFLGEETDYAKELGFTKLNPQTFYHFLDYHRGHKTEYEIQCMRQASQLGVLGHLAAEKSFRQGCSEFEIHLAYLQACGHNDPKLPYSNIIALNHHSAVLHYHALQQQRPESSLSFLIDAGGSYHGYASDITRSYCADDSKTGQTFLAMIEAMDHGQQRLAAKVKAGQSYPQLHLQAHSEIAQILADFDLVDLSPDEIVERGISRSFFPHGLGHLIGLQVHDTGGFIESAAGGDTPKLEDHPFLRLTRNLEQGHVVTIEPGLYFIDVLLNELKKTEHAQYLNWEKIEQLKPYGGIRIEDDVLVTGGNPVNLTRDAFAKHH